MVKNSGNLYKNKGKIAEAEEMQCAGTTRIRESSWKRPSADANNLLVDAHPDLPLSSFQSYYTSHLPVFPSKNSFTV